jgi:hypothetical protein
VIVTVRDLDGFLYDEMQAGRLPADEWLNGQALLITSTTSIEDLYSREKDGTDPAIIVVRNAARSGVNAMVRQIQQLLYLQLGPARLRAIRAQDPFVTQSANGDFQFEFLVHYDASDAAEWQKLRNIRASRRPVSVTVGFDFKDVSRSIPTDLTASSMSSTDTLGQTFSFLIFSPKLSYSVIAVYMLATLGMIAFSRYPNFLRDPDGPLRDGECVFSLARTQLAWWFFVILGCWLFLYTITGSIDCFNSTALLLISIGSGTALGGVVAGKINTALSGANPNAPIPTVDAAQRPPAFRSGLGAVIYDTLSDDDDKLAFHRFQLLAWHGILGLVFAFEVWKNLAMPDFDSTVLGLLGISGATYAGFKTAPIKQA